MARPERHNQFTEALRADRRYASADEPFGLGRPQPTVPPAPLSPVAPRPGVPRQPLGAFPPDAVAVIERPARLVTQGGRRSRGWRLRFAPRARTFHDPLTGWVGGQDPLAHVELTFPTRGAAVRYAERQKVPYELREPARRGGSGPAPSVELSEPLLPCVRPTGPHPLCCGNYPPPERRRS